MERIEKDVDNRTLVIRNFRNLGPFCVGSKDDLNEDKAFLKLNRSLKKDELGGLVILIGANNCGKSNVIDALDRYNTSIFTDNDYTDFTYAERVEPNIGMNVANGKYGENISKRAIKYSGAPQEVLLAFLMEKENYLSYLELISKGSEKYDESNFPYYNYVTKMINVICPAFQGQIVSDQWFTKLLEERTDLIYDSDESIEIMKDSMDRSKAIDKRGLTNYCGPNGSKFFLPDQRIELTTEGTPIDDRIYTLLNTHVGRSFIVDEYPNDSNVRYLIDILSTLEVEYTSVRNVDKSDDNKFLKAFGYDLNDFVYRYSRKRINQSDLVCKPSELNGFFYNLLNIVGYNSDVIKNAYAGTGNLRVKLEKDLNRSLVSVADELNDMLNINEKKYSLQIKLERENIEFFISYGDDVPLNIDRQSEGFKWLFELFFNLIKVHEFNPGDIILMDEFGNSLGFSTIRELTKKLRDYGKKNGLTFVLATQNPMAVDILHLDEVRLIVPKDDGSSYIVNEFDHFGEEGDHDVMGPIVNGLMISRNYLRSENRRTVFVEGVTDYFYLNTFSEIFRSKGKNIDIDFIPINGLGRFKESPIKVLDQIRSIERYPLMFIDSDKKGEQFRKAAEKVNIHPSTISEVFDGNKTVIEDLFSKKDAEELGILPKSFDKAACLSYRLPEIYDDLEDETKQNFERVIDYVMSQ